MSKTIDYYNQNAQAFYDRTISADISESYQKFLKLLPEKAYILDAGCGVGRDTKYFLSQGYKVSAFDASEEMVQFATRETGLDVMQLKYQDLNFQNCFDGIWAQASLLHVPYEETRNVYRKIHKALRPGGIFFASYKYGSSSMPTVDRDFWNMTEITIKPFLTVFFEICEIWIEEDTRSKVAPSKDQKWLNFLARKI